MNYEIIGKGIISIIITVVVIILFLLLRVFSELLIDWLTFKLSEGTRALIALIIIGLIIIFMSYIVYIII